MNLDRLVGEAKAAADEQQAAALKMALIAEEQYALATQVAASYRQLCRQVAERLKAQGKPTSVVFYPFRWYTTRQPVPFPLRGWGVAGHVLLEDGRLLRSYSQRAPRPDEDWRLGSFDDSRVALHAGLVEPGETYLVIVGEEDAFTLRPKGPRPHNLRPFHGELELSTVRPGTDPQGCSVTWKSSDGEGNTLYLQLEETLARLLVT
ncbi:MAG: hypothetical protein J0I14_01940 [Propionibacteriaceae bacterium]|jgi:hypothetical protein|nr:hypothetical protein [Propionibacteriaceae bacterium]